MRTISAAKGLVLACIVAVAPASLALADVVSDAVDRAVADMTTQGAKRVKIDKRLNGNTRVRGFTKDTLYVVIIDKKTGDIESQSKQAREDPNKIHWSQQGPDFADIEGR